jgi:hypothetical protein
MGRARSFGGWLRRGALHTARSRTTWVAIACLAVGIGGPPLAKSILHLHGGHLERLVERAGDGLLIAAVIALLLDVPARAAVNNALSEGVLWGLANPVAPSFHRQALQEVASDKTVITKAEWSIRFDQDRLKQECLQLTISLQSWGQTFEENGRFPFGKAAVLASIDERDSRYKRWEIRTSGGELVLGVTEADFTRAEQDRTYISRREDGTVEFDISAARKAHRTEHKFNTTDHFHRHTEVEVFRHQRGFFPVWSDFSTQETVIKLEGDAVGSHNFTLARLDQTHVEHWNPSMGHQPNFKIKTLPPAGVLILSWSPHSAPA